MCSTKLLFITRFLVIPEAVTPHKQLGMHSYFSFIMANSLVQHPTSFSIFKLAVIVGNIPNQFHSNRGN